MGNLTRTQRTYNKKPTVGGPGFKGWITTETGRFPIKYQKYVTKSEIFDLDKRQNINLKDSHPSEPFWSDYHPYHQTCRGHCKYCKDHRLRSRRRQARKRELGMVAWYESDTYCFMWNWSWRDVLDGLFGEFLAEKELKRFKQP